MSPPLLALFSTVSLAQTTALVWLKGCWATEC